jgi:phospholipid transport system substrate-binding protein
MMRLTIFAFVMLFPLFLILQDASCEAGIPTERVRSILEEVMAIQTNPQLQGDKFRNEKRIAIKKVIAQNFHFDAMAKQALGQHWQALNETKRSEFKAIFQDLFQESYTRLVLDFLGREKILYNKEEIRQNQAMVKTTIVRISEEIPVDYSLAAVEQKWLVDDVKIDGVSIVQNYQKSFSRVIQQESFEGLLKRMRLQQQAIERTS